MLDLFKLSTLVVMNSDSGSRSFPKHLVVW